MNITIETLPEILPYNTEIKKNKTKVKTIENSHIHLKI